MKLFGGKREGEAADGGTSDRGNASGTALRVERRFTIGLTRAEQLAVMLAKSRAAKVVEVADMLAGMYIYEWDRLSRFWGEHEEIEEFLRRICQISPQRWNYWITFYDKQRSQEEEQALSLVQRARKTMRKAAERRFAGNGNESRWPSNFLEQAKRYLRPWKTGADGNAEAKLERSTELEEAFKAAGAISPFRDRADGREVPVLTSECVLFCIATNAESELSRTLRETGLDLEALERAARDPRRAPHH